MPLYMQDPTNEHGAVLHEQILEACANASYGAGAFAFASRDGIDLLMNDTVFRQFATAGRFHLVVGIDEITNIRALDRLKESSDELPGLSVQVFHHEDNGRIFHPKVCWFRNEQKGFLVTGSGNLTTRGLRANWEAFAVNLLADDEANALEAQWDEWIARHAARLKAVDHEDVRARAAQNIRRPQARRRRSAGREEVALVAAVDLGGTAPVLIAEIPGANNLRWNQANFDLGTYERFFGMERGLPRRLVLQHVTDSGQLAEVENRQGVSVASSNFRIELGAAAHLAYPQDHRPIGVFVRIAPRFFRYRLLMPGDAAYQTIDTLLGRLWVGRADRMRRAVTSVDVLEREWPASPLWHMPLELEE